VEIAGERIGNWRDHGRKSEKGHTIQKRKVEGDFKDCAYMTFSEPGILLHFGVQMNRTPASWPFS
jgi:hypothetical protein